MTLLVHLGRVTSAGRATNYKLSPRPSLELFQGSAEPHDATTGRFTAVYLTALYRFHWFVSTSTLLFSTLRQNLSPGPSLIKFQ